MPGTYNVTSIISQTADKFSAMVEFNGTPEQPSEVDLEVLTRARAALDAERVAPQARLDELNEQIAIVSAELESDPENSSRIQLVLDELEVRASALEATLADLDARIASNQASASDTAAYINAQLQQIADDAFDRAEEVVSIDEAAIDSEGLVI